MYVKYVPYIGNAGKSLGYSDPDRSPHPEFGGPELRIFQLKKNENFFTKITIYFFRDLYEKASKAQAQRCMSSSLLLSCGQCCKSGAF
jgi:hypothetical protein